MEEERMKKMKKSLAAPPPPLPTSFSSLPYDVALNCLARISRFHHPTLSLVSKTFQSLLASPDLNTTRSRIGKTENLLYFCLNLNINPNNPRWFILSPIPNQKLIPIPSFPYQQHPKSATYVSIGSEIYVIGGLVNGERSKRVFLLDCPSHHWRILPEMRVPRESAAVDVSDGKIYVIRGCERNTSENWGEVYDPKTQIWELLPPTKTLEGRVVLGGKVCAMYGLRLELGGKIHYVNGLKLDVIECICLVEIDNVLCQTSVCGRVLTWYDPNEKLGWTKVKGLEVLETRLFPSAYFPCYLTPNTISSGGRRVTVWWKSMKHFKDRHPEECQTEIWCAEISFERRSSRELWGFLEWSKKVFAFDGCDYDFDFVLHSALMIY